MNFQGPLGKKLMHKLAVKTASLNPPHTYVPWLTINGQHNEKLQAEAWKDLIGLICRLYKGDFKPKQCLKSSKFTLFQLIP